MYILIPSYLLLLFIGTLGFDPLGFAPTTPKGLETMKVKELNNGRLAMIGVLGMMVQELATHQQLFH